ncbi:MAG: 50S ribosomal protein L3 N(5)-glutamine methyltransferase [Sterolibacteriaceae bacterium]|uniref:Ribosomal protein uL3 glutamine methyltransferase n=1 Tax=Candidatus Methylophosphatis roskildensis TaxID=2899263 RepID=A0A9D7HLM5_9PROT|nr:50S ribosomal protein L3 N(5)-glutamine methyltransferase [Candidatus Methylophosphatis roskildensis]
MTANHDELLTLRDWLRYAVSRFNSGGLFFGHGTTNAYDEAAWLILHTLHLPHDQLDPFLDARLTGDERIALARIIDRRVVERLPAAYLTGEAWLRDYRFHVDQRVIVPRSYFADLIFDDAFAPWLPDCEAVSNVLDLCTGSGCLAILLADAYPDAAVDAVDISADALEVARRNIGDHGLDQRIRLVQSDLFAGLADRRYDLIICNPPYVTAAAIDSLPPEYRHEPMLALAAGTDGLDVVRRVLALAGEHLGPNGILAVEVGHNRAIVEKAFPWLSMVWLSAASGEDKVFLVERCALPG